MLASGVPAKFPLPFGAYAGGGYINTIPTPSQTGSAPGRASFTDGFPPVNFQPVASGGVPPFGGDFNGILNQITANIQYWNAGYVPQYDSTFSSAIGGYPNGALIAGSAIGAFYVSTADRNTSNPNSGGANWQSLFVGLAPLASPALTGTPTVPTAAAGTNNTQAASTAFCQSLPRFQNIQVFTSSGTFTVPAGVSFLDAIVVGGGGGGGKCAGTIPSSDMSGSGGGGGGAAIGVYPSAPGANIPVTIGAGGASQVNGGTSSFGSIVSASGGGGGGFQATATSAGGPGGTGSGGTYNVSGGFGSDGQSGSLVFAGNGGASIFGGAGRASALGQNAQGQMNGHAYGAGAGGAYNSNSASGGTGAQGIVIVRW